MPLAPVNDNGTQLYYEDSGAPDTDSYVTLVLIHGTVFHAPIFRRMFAFSMANDIRLVAVTLRDYPGSTPLSPPELAALMSPDRETQASMIQDRGLELAAFLTWFIETEAIPPVSVLTTDDGSDKDIGGLSILGWSSGNCTTLSFLAHADTIAERSRTLLDAYLRTIVIYDPCYHAFGVPHPSLDQLYGPLRDPSIPPEQIGEKFSRWAGGYYAHMPTALSSFATLSRAEFYAGLAQTPISNPPLNQQPSLARMSAAEVAATTDWVGAPRSYIPMISIDQTIYEVNKCRALLDATIWPRLRATLVWCDMSVGETMIAAWDLARSVSQSWPEGARKVDVRRMEGANHFPHWDQPEYTTQFLASII
ncbi:hypothetical protein AcW1_003659 [Taiwanofungus camphoratus]|nr:hypothetical protein AcV5_007348 [Antrodia cinnamomea]KAI0940471.1 hypothetical protein AcW1_003659 [Antrodia cinnamomea]